MQALTLKILFMSNYFRIILFGYEFSIDTVGGRLGLGPPTSLTSTTLHNTSNPSEEPVQRLCSPVPAYTARALTGSAIAQHFI